VPATTTTVPRTTTTVPNTTSTTEVPVGTTAAPTTTSVQAPETTVLQSTTVPENEETTAAERLIVESIEDEELAEDVAAVFDGDVTVDEISQLVESDKFDELTPEQLVAVAEALNEADDSVKEVFEQNVNIFSSGLDTYVPSGSNINVGERRIIIAATAVVMAAPAVSSGGGGGRRRG
jgi:hypothetical protein